MTSRSTSQEAFAALLSTGKLRGKQRAVATAVYAHGPGTSAEILSLSGQLDANRNLARARFTELRDAGVIREDGVKKCSITGRQAIVWVFDPGATPKKRETPSETIERLEQQKKMLAEVLEDALGVIECENVTEPVLKLGRAALEAVR